MAQGLNAAKNGHPGREYWSRRPFSMWSPSKETKVLTHRLERRWHDRDLQHEVNGGE